VSDERARLFVALELPRDARAALADWTAPLIRAEAALRPIEAQALHVTLCFLGWRRVDEIEPIGATCRALAAGSAPALSFGEATWLPPRRPRVLAVALIDAGSRLDELQASLSRGLEAGSWYTPEARPFLAHVTLARVRKDGRVRRRDLPPAPELSFHATSVTLFRSRLSPGGAQYEQLSEVRLTR
jgi:RNA 2',3'-cyclic 3'-phosphodiesterase